MVESKVILITGVGGLLGSRLADYIIENHPQHKVVGVDDLSGGYRENINKRAVIEVVIEKSKIPKSWKNEINK